MKNIKSISSFAVLLVLISAFESFGQNSGTPFLRQEDITALKIRETLRDDGFSVTIDKDGDVEVGDLPGSVWISPPKKDGAPVVQCYSYIDDPKGQIPGAKIDAFNNAFFPKAVRDGDRIEFEWTFIIAGGLSQSSLKLNLALCVTGYHRFLREFLR